MPATASEHKTRITARVTPSTQSLLEEAAAFMGVPLNSFLVTAAIEKAGDVLANERIIKLGQRDAELLERMMEHPAEPNAALLKAAKNYKKIVRE